MRSSALPIVSGTTPEPLSWSGWRESRVALMCEMKTVQFNENSVIGVRISHKQCKRTVMEGAVP